MSIELTPKQQLAQEKKGMKLLKNVLKSLKSVNSDARSMNELVKIWSPEELAVIANQAHIQAILAEISLELSIVNSTFK